jgi:HD-GYP domain-containing protein (c-di-GMP phosphodiesterase class II)
MPREVALMEIARNAGTQFDPAVVDAFLIVARSNPDGFQGEDEDYGPHVETADSASHFHNGHTQPRLPAAR